MFASTLYWVSKCQLARIVVDSPQIFNWKRYLLCLINKFCLFHVSEFIRTFCVPSDWLLYTTALGLHPSSSSHQKGTLTIVDELVCDH